MTDHNAPRGVVAIVYCAACGDWAADIELDAHGQLAVRTGRRDWQRDALGRGDLQAVRCPEHGRLDVTWQAIAMRTTRRPSKVNAPPVSTP